MKKFDIPGFYKSSFIGEIKRVRKQKDPKKKDFTPTVIDFGNVTFLVARHFGFCFGVENAIEIAYKAINENPDKRVFLLSQMIHNPIVNADLESRGVRFIMDTLGNQLIDWTEITSEDVVIIPAFGTTIEIEKKLASIGVEVTSYNTTCPFVERVWKASKKLGSGKYTTIIHGKHKHEETRATFSHSSEFGASIVIKDITEARLLIKYMAGEMDEKTFSSHFGTRVSKGFDPKKDLTSVGVVNQTTMLAIETQEIASAFKEYLEKKHGADYKTYFADTRDTLCYATNDNQEATYGLLKHTADMAIVVGGYNSSNTSHIVELCEKELPTYFIESASKIHTDGSILHFDLVSKGEKVTEGILSNKKPRIMLTSGASCPDTIVDQVIDRFLELYNISDQEKETVLASIE